MTYANMSIGETLSAQVNWETILPFPPRVVPNGFIAALPPVRNRTGANTPHFQGVIDGGLYWDALSRADFNTLIYAVFGGFDVPYVDRYLWHRDAAHHLSPYLVRLVQPRAATPDEEGDYTLEMDGDVSELTIPIWDCQRQTIDVDSDTTMSAADGLLLVDTSVDDVTITLPAAADVGANTVKAIEKSASAHNLTVQAADGDTLNPITVTARWDRVTVASDGAARWVQVLSYEDQF